jgi:hypothetical protein
MSSMVAYVIISDSIISKYSIIYTHTQTNTTQHNTNPWFIIQVNIDKHNSLT